VYTTQGRGCYDRDKFFAETKKGHLGSAPSASAGEELSTGDIVILTTS